MSEIFRENRQLARPFVPAAGSGGQALERSSAAELELLHDVILTLGDRDRVVEAQRSERRGPDQADTDRAAYHVLLGELQSKAGTGRVRVLRRWGTAGHV